MLDAKLLAVIRAIGVDIKALLVRAPVVLRTTANQASVSTNLVNLTGLTTAIAANASYRVTGRVVFMSSLLTSGATIGFTGPAGSACLLSLVVPATNLLATNTASNRFAGASGSVTVSSVSLVGGVLVATIDGIVHSGSTAGTFALQFASSSALGTATALPNSTLVVERLG